MNCKYYRTRTEKGTKYGYCLKDKKKVSLFCKECEEYKNTIKEKMHNNCENKSNNSKICTINKKYCAKSKKLAKLERNRFSILTDDLEHCIICGSKKDNLHEVFFGTGNRAKSMEYGCVIPLCFVHHTQMHKNKEWQDYWHKQAQKRFMEYYHKSIDEFIDVFGKNYL